jgi:hypothetical protein
VVGIFARNGICYNVRHCGIECRLLGGIGFEANTHIVGDGLEESDGDGELTALGHLRFGARILDILSETSHVGNSFPAASDDRTDFTGKAA